MTWLWTKQLTPNLVLVLLMSVYQNSESIQAVISFVFESFSKTENLYKKPALTSLSLWK